MTIDELREELIDTEVFYARYQGGNIMSRKRADAARAALVAEYQRIEAERDALKEAILHIADIADDWPKAQP
jgi:hypothetical protein